MARFGSHSTRISFGSESLTHFGGLFLLHRFFQKLALRSGLAHHVQFPQRNNRYAISESLLALLCPIILGLGRVETSQLLKYNGVFQYLTGLRTFPNSQTLRRFLIRFGEAGLPRFLRLHDALQQEVFKRPKCPSLLIFDWDTTVLTVYGRQEKAAVGYNPRKRGRRSYLPLLCLEGQTRDCWDASYHPGNVHPGSIFLPAFQRAFAKVPRGVQEIRVRADQAFYDHEIIEFLEGKRAFYVMAARLTRPLQERVTAVRYHRVSGETYAAEFHYQPSRWPGSRRFVAIRRTVPEEPSFQLTLWQMNKYSCQVLVANLDLTPLNLWRFYNDRARAELIIRELKEAYALGKIPTRIWGANVAHFHLAVFAYNLLNWFKRLCVAPEWQKLTLQTLRNRLLLIPAELVRPQGRWALKMPRGYPHQNQFLKTLKRIDGFRLT